jgi:hypothetical protein
MTENRNFKRAVRDRMSQTGEKYMVARRALLEERETRESEAVEVEVAALDAPLTHEEEMAL